MILKVPSNPNQPDSMKHETLIIVTVQEKTPEAPGIPGLLIPVAFAQGQECGDGFAGTCRRCLRYP